ncbi:peptide chain release factor N(5)-glutamine methyltransferase [Microgenomates group bacterium]|nr:peptide chain release factor N(5)-glutamine methyltransferase [Microgenomates group bacterium]
MRKWLVWEKNWLIAHGFSIKKPDLGAYSESPVEYITGRAAWLDGEIGVNEYTLIPRMETEELVELVMDDLVSLGSSGKLEIAEVGTGSGAIAIGVASELKKRGREAQIIASDISRNALKKAQENAAEWGIEKKEIWFLESDLMKNYPQGKKFDLIVANLPYIPSSRIANLEASVRDFEPKLALDGGADGVELITKCLGQVKAYLKPQGWVWLEVDETHDEGIIKKYKLEREWGIEIIKDHHNRVRFWCCKLL